MPRSRVTLLAWLVAISFLLATVLQYLDQSGLLGRPPELPGANMVDRVLGSAEFRQQIWPVFLWTHLLFAVGFVAAVTLAAVVAAASGVPRGLPMFVSLATTGGIIAAIASIIPVGAVNAGVWLGYCDCVSKESEVIAQVWSEMVAQDIGDWFNRFASVVLGVGLLALIREAGTVLSPGLRSWTYVLAAALIVAPVLITVGRFDPVPELLTAAIGALLVPVWAVWLGRAVEASPSGSTA